MFANFAHAESFLERGSVKNSPFYNMHDESLWERLSSIVGKAEKTIDWFADIKQHIYDFSTDVFAFIFKMLMFVGFQTPSFIFNNAFTANTTLLFSALSVSVVILLTIYESLIQMTSKVSKASYTKFSTIMKRFPLVIALSGLSPYLFEKGFQLINRLTKGISTIGGDLFSGNNLNGLLTLSGIDVVGMLLFDVIALGLIVPILTQSGRRWWDLFCLCIISPLAFTAYLFDRHNHLFKKWWRTVKELSFVQLVYATFIVLLGVFLYGTRFLAADLWFVKILIIIGALHRLANPPSFVKQYNRTSRERGKGLLDGYKAMFRDVKNATDIRNYGVLKYYYGQKDMKSKKAALQLKHGRRFVDDLLKPKR